MNKPFRCKLGLHKWGEKWALGNNRYAYRRRQAELYPWQRFHFGKLCQLCGAYGYE